MNDLHPMASAGYGEGAQTYARGRPGFPPEVLHWLRTDLGVTPGRSVLELGAGTGKFTRLLCQTGADVLAVEPVAAMLEQLESELPNVAALRASARNLPLGDASVDIVICAQSFHWFATREALAEIHRVLKPQGLLGLIWNLRDASVPWVAALDQIVNRHEGDAPRYFNGEWRRVFPAPGFGPFREKSVPHSHTGPAEQVIVDRVASVSFVAAMAESARQALLEEVRALIAATAELAHHSTVSMPYVAQMFWCASGPPAATGRNSQAMK